MKIIRLSSQCTTVDQITREVCSELIKSLDSINEDKKYTDQFLDIISQRGCTVGDFDNSLNLIRKTFEDLMAEPSDIRNLPVGVEKSLFSTALNAIENRFMETQINRENLAKLWKRILVNDRPKLRIN